MPEPSALPSLTQLYREHFDAVWATLRRLGVPPGSLEDAVHDVFMVVHRQRERFEGRSTVRTWLLGIARRIAHRYRRTHARTQRRHHALATVIPPTSHPDDDIARQEGWRALQGFLDELDEDKRAAFVLGELERLSRQELGDALGVSPNTAWSRLRAARARFKVRFSEPGLERALAAGRHAEPAPAESRERVWLVVAGSLREVAVPAAAAGSAWSAKGVLVTLGLAAAGLGAVTVVARATHGSASSGQHDDGAGPARTSREEVAEARTTAIAATPTAATPAVVVPADAVSIPSMATATPGTAATVLPATSIPAGASAPTTTTATSPGTPSASAIPSGVRPTPASPARLDPRASAPNDTSAHPPSPAASSSVDAPPTADALEAEAALLLSARAALEGGRPRDALAALDEHRRRFARGALAEERDATHVLTRCALGQHDAAIREARALVAAHQRSAYLDVLADSCAAEVTNPARAGD